MNSVTWAVFEASEPQLAGHVRARLEAGINFLATIRPDGHPRLHPVGVRFDAGSITVPMTPTSPKGKDITRNGMYALHCCVEDDSGGDGEVLITGSARARETAVGHEAHGWVTFEFLVGEVLAVSNDGGEINRVRWKAPTT